jgi:hypothetical protein
MNCKELTMNCNEVHNELTMNRNELTMNCNDLHHELTMNCTKA